MSIVGYTNVGKSSLLNTLTRSNETAMDRLFATLDPVSRRLTTPEGTVCILTDTVGLIRDMPPELERAFAATFEEMGDADLLLHLADASAPDLEDQIQAVGRVLEKLGLDHIPVMRVLNKADLVDPEVAGNLRRRYRAPTVCALDRPTLGPVIELLRKTLTAAGEGGTGRKGPREGDSLPGESVP